MRVDQLQKEEKRIMNKVIALVLAGGNVAGYGVLTRNRAKAALTFGGHYRVCDFVLSNLSNSRVGRVGLIIQYLPGSLMSHVGNGRWWEFSGGGRVIKIMPPFMGFGKTNWFRGTGDCVFRNLDFVEDSDAEHVLILSCEHIYSMDLRPFFQYHLDTGSAMTLVGARLPEERLSRRFGYPEMDPQSGRLLKLTEKPDRPVGNLVFTGIALFRRDILVRKLIENAQTPGMDNLTYHVIVPMAKEQECYVYEHKGFWDYLEHVGRYHEIHMEMAAGRSPVRPGEWDVMTNLDYRRLGSLPPTTYTPTAEVAESLISPGAAIAGKVVRSVISPGVTIQEGAVVEDSILLHDCLVGPGARLKRVIADRDAVFGPECVVGEGPEALAGMNPELPEGSQQLVVVGKRARIAPRLRVGPATQIYPSADTEAMGLTEVCSGDNVRGGGSECWLDSDGVPPLRAVEAPESRG